MREIMKILVADKVPDELITRLATLGAEVSYSPDLNADSLPDAIGNALVLTMLRDEDINIEEMQNAIFETNKAACCTLSLDKLPCDAVVQALNDDVDIIEVLK